MLLFLLIYLIPGAFFSGIVWANMRGEGWDRVDSLTMVFFGCLLWPLKIYWAIEEWLNG